MTIDNNGNPRAIHDLSRLAYLQGVLIHRRVLIVADDPALAEFILKSRARHVTSICAEAPAIDWPGDPAVAGELVVSDLQDLELRDGAFDLAIALDLTVAREPAALVNELRRVVGTRGFVVVGVPNPTCERRIGPDPGELKLDYYQLYDLLSDAFSSVQMIGQAPFVGYAISDLAASDERGVGFDAGLLEDGAEEIEWFMAVCGDRALNLDAYSIVQLPMSSLAMGGASAAELDAAYAERDQLLGEARALEEDLQRTRLELGTRGVRIETLEKDVESEHREAEAARERAVKIAKQFDDDRKAAQAKRLEEEMSKRGSEMELQAKARAAAVELRQALARAESAEASRDDLVERIRGDAAELEKLRERLSELEDKAKAQAGAERERAAELERLRREIDAARADTAATKAAKERLRQLEREAASDRETFERDVAALEARVVDLSRQLSAANEELARREAMIRDLVVDLERRAESEARADEIKERDQRLLQLEGELQAAVWRAEELEARGGEGARTLAETEAACASKDAVIAALEEQLAVLEEAMAAARGTVSGQHRARVEAELALATAAREAERREAEIHELSETERDLEEKLAAAVGAISGQHRARVEAELALATALREAERREVELNEQIVANRELEERFAASAGAHSGHRRARLEAELALATAAREAEQRATELDEQIAAVRDLEDRLAAATGALSGHRRARLEAELASATFSREKDLLAAELAEAAARELAESSALEAERAKSAATERALIEARGRIRNLEEDLERSMKRAESLDGIDINAAALQADLDAERRRSVELEQSCAAARRNTERLEADLDRDREHATHLAADLSAANERCAALAVDVERAAEARARMEGDLSALRLEAGEAKADTLGLRARIAELEGLAARADEARAAAAAADGRLGETQSSLEHMRTELGRVNWRVGELSAEVERTREALERERHITTETRVELEAAERELDQLRRRQAELESTEGTARGRTEALLHEAEEARRMANDEMERTRQAGADAARLAGEVDRLTKSLAAAVRKADEKQVEADATERALAALRLEVDAMNDQRAQLKEQIRAEQVRSSSLRADVDQLHEAERKLDALLREKAGAAAEGSRLAELEERLRAAQGDAEREREAHAAAAAQLVAELESTRSSLEVRQNQLQEYAADLGETRRENERAEQRCEELTAERQRLVAELAAAKDEAQRARAFAGDGAELAQLKLTAARQAERIRELSEEATSNEPLLQSLTAQLEEREKRAATAERKIKQLEGQIREHESDAAAWNTEIKFRNARVTQLEEEIGKLRTQAVEPMSRGPIERRVSHAPAQVETAREIDQLKAQVHELNDAMGDKDAELLMLHARSDGNRRCLVRARQALQNMLSSGQVQSALALQLHDIIAAMERDGG